MKRRTIWILITCLALLGVICIASLFRKSKTVDSGQYTPASEVIPTDQSGTETPSSRTEMPAEEKKSDNIEQAQTEETEKQPDLSPPSETTPTGESSSEKTSSQTSTSKKSGKSDKSKAEQKKETGKKHDPSPATEPALSDEGSAETPASRGENTGSENVDSTQKEDTGKQQDTSLSDDLGKTETQEELVLPEVEIPVVPADADEQDTVKEDKQENTSDQGSSPSGKENSPSDKENSSSGQETPPQEPSDDTGSGSEQNHLDIHVDKNGDILLPEVP